MALLVLDVSVTVAWFAPDERTAHTQSLLDRVAAQGAVVPLLWPIEVGNALLFVARSRRISPGQRQAALVELSQLQISADDATVSNAWGATLDLADRFRLTLYDACYLELANRRELPLASLDRDLRKAARTLGIELLGM